MAIWGYQFNGRIVLQNVEQAQIKRLQIEMDQLQRHIELELREGLLSAVQEEISTLGVNPSVELAFVSDHRDIIIAANRFALVGTRVDEIAHENFHVSIRDRLAQLKTSKETLSSKVFLEGDGANEHVIGIYPVVTGRKAGELRPTLIGLLYAQSNIAVQKASALQNVERQIIQFISILVTLALFLWLFLDYRITQRIRKIEDVTHMVSEGNLTARISLTGSDEISQVSSAIDNMISHWAKAEERLVKLSRGVEQSSEAMIIMDFQGCVEYVNPAYLNASGFEHDDVVGQMAKWFENKNDPVGRDLWGHMILGNTWQGRIQCLKKDGSSYPSMLTVSPIRDNAGNIINFVGVQQNLTEHENLEGQLRQSQKMEALGTLVGGIAHEFNNTLAGINGSLYLAKKMVPQQPDVLKKLNVIETLVFKSSDLIKSLLSFTHKGVIQKKAIPLIPLIKETIGLIEIAMTGHIQMESDLNSEEVNILGDATLIQQAILNIVNNARDAVSEIERPSIAIKVKTFAADPAFLEEHPECRPGDYAKISVSDNGCGIKPEGIQKIFEPFYTTKEVGMGTGLGLSMAYGAIQSHDGALEIQTVVDMGTLVRIYLPIIEVEPVEAADESSTDVINGQGETILFVDDNRDVLEVGTNILKSLNYKVLIARNGQEAMAVFNASKDFIDLVLLDVVMPIMDGVEAAGLIRTEKPEQKVIFSTGYDREHIRKSDDITSDEIISKPFKVHELSQVLHTVLNARP